MPMRQQEPTKVEVYTEIKNVLIDILGEEQSKKYCDFIDNELRNLAVKAKGAKRRYQKEQEEKKNFTTILYEILTDEFVTINDLVEDINDDTIGFGRVRAHLTKLIEQGLVEKTYIKVKGIQKPKAFYRRKDQGPEEIEYPEWEK